MQRHAQEELVVRSSFDETDFHPVDSFAHEIAQPIAAICQYSDLAQRELDGDIPQEIHEYITQLHSAARYAAELLVEFRRQVDDRVVDQAHCSLDDLLVLALQIDQMQRRPSDRSLILEYELNDFDVPVVVDRTAIVQVFLNLLRNGIEATRDNDEERRVRIQAEERDGFINVAVCDNGCGLRGITSAELFRAGHSTKANGLGIGLSICKRILQNHDGAIWYTPGTPGGSEFHFRLPLSRECYVH